MPIIQLRGQTRALRRLLLARSAGRLGHALLLVGPSGIGKRRLAMALAQALECTSPRAPSPREALRDLGACGACEPCEKVAAGLHPDVQIVEPDGAFIKIAQVRSLTAFLASPPHEGRYKVAILDPADALRTEAGNALLKTLEEPRAQTQFVLVATRPEQLLPTVRSRCHRILCTPLDEADVAALLIEEHGVEEALALRLAGRARGSVGRALAARESLDESGQAAELATQLAGVAGVAGPDGRPTRLLEVLDATAQIRDRDQARAVFLELLEAQRAAAVESARRGEEQAAERAAERYLFVTRALEALDGNASPQLTAEELVIRLRSGQTPLPERSRP